MSQSPLRVLVVGATGSIGRATVDALLSRGHRVTCFVRDPVRDRDSVRGDVARGSVRDDSTRDDSMRDARGRRGLPDACDVRHGDVSSRDSVRDDAFGDDSFDAVVSCMASRTGAPRDAWEIDHAAQLNVLHGAVATGVGHFVLLSAICVQRPRLEFQRAKLAFEEALRDSGLEWSIVRPTAFFKSLSGQIDRVRAGKPYLLFGDGRLTACTPIADEDLGDFLVDCLEKQELRNRILPIGGPGPALTPRDQGELLFEVADMEPRFRSVSPRLLDVAIAVLSLGGRMIPALRERAELARIGRYYATESMLVWDDSRGLYDADATPVYGTRTLQEYFERRLTGELGDQRGEHAVL